MNPSSNRCRPPAATASARLVVLALAAILGVCPPAPTAFADEPVLPPDGKLSRIEAIQLGVSRNYALLARRLESQRLDLLERAASTSYWPSLILDTALQRTSPPTDLLGREYVASYAGGFAWDSPVGTRLTARLQMNDGVGDSAGRGHGGTLNLALVQPLLKDGWLAGATLPLREAELSAQIQRELFRDQVEAFASEIEAALWDVAFARADLTIKTRSRDRARQQFDDTAENIRRGILAEGEIYVVEESVVLYEQELVRGEESLRLARRRLAELLQLTPDVPLEAREPLEPPELRLPARQTVIEAGLQASPRVAAQRIRRAVSSARLAYASNQALPALDLDASVALGANDRVYRTAWGNLFADPAPDARIGLTFTLPLDRRGVDSTLSGARLEEQRQDLLLKSEEVRVHFAIDNDLTSLETIEKLVSLARRRVTLAELKLKAETEKYKNGISTLAEVIRFQRDVDDALSGLQRVARSARLGIARLLADQGRLGASAGVGVR